MANLLPVTLQDIQDKINTLTQSSVDTPLSTDDQWKIRLNYINLAVSAWARLDVYWRQLFANYAGTGTINSSQQYAIDTADFRQMASLLRFVNPTTGGISYVDIIDPKDILQRQSSTRYAYILGNPATGYTLNLGWKPTVNDGDYGSKWNFDYYTNATKLQNPTDKPQMSDPDYIVYWSAAQELTFNGRTDLANMYLSEATRCMDNMKITNELMPAFASLSINDVDSIRDNAVWGL